jgi:hypothetical protein
MLGRKRARDADADAIADAVAVTDTDRSPVVRGGIAALLEEVGNRALLDVWHHEPLTRAIGGTHMDVDMNYSYLSQFLATPECSFLGALKTEQWSDEPEHTAAYVSVPTSFIGRMSPMWRDATNADPRSRRFKTVFLSLRQLGAALYDIYLTWRALCPDARMGLLTVHIHHYNRSGGHAEVFLFDAVKQTVELCDSNGGDQLAYTPDTEFIRFANEHVGAAARTFTEMARRHQHDLLATSPTLATSSTWTYWSPSYICPRGVGPQSFEFDVDPALFGRGLCTAFARLYALLRITAPDIDPAELVARLMACGPVPVLTLVRKIYDHYMRVYASV